MKRRVGGAAAGAALLFVTTMLTASPAYADVGGGPSLGVALLVVVLAGIGVAIIGTVSWFALRGLASRRREREADARRAQHRAREAEKRP
jgi:hypothetical protein